MDFDIDFFRTYIKRCLTSSSSAFIMIFGMY